MKFSQSLFGFLLVTATVALASSSQYNEHQNGATSYNNAPAHTNSNNYNSNQQATNNNYNSNHHNNQQSSAAQSYQQNVNNCYGASNCNRAYPTNQAPAATSSYQTAHKSPYGTAKVVPAIYGGQGLFNYRGYARVPARAAPTRPGYGLSLKPIRALALSGPASHQPHHYRPRPAVHHRPATHYAPRRQPRAPRNRPMSHGYQPRPTHRAPYGPARRPSHAQRRPNCAHRRPAHAARAQYRPRPAQDHSPRPVRQQNNYSDHYNDSKQYGASAKKGSTSGGY